MATIFDCQGVAQNNNQTNKQTNQNSVSAKTNPQKLKLNNEDAGNTDDTSVLSKKLEEIFKNREDNGILREGTNEVEKTLYLAGDRSVSAEEIGTLFGFLNKLSASPILIPVEIKNPIVPPKPNPLTLLVYAGAEKSRLVKDGIQVDFTGEFAEKNNNFPPDKDAIAISVDKSGVYSMDGKQFLAIDLETEVTNRLKPKAKDKKIVFVRAENYGNLEDAATIAKSAGAVKIFFVTKNIVHKENGITFLLSPAFIKDKDTQQIDGFASIIFKRSDSGKFEITLPNELFSKERADAEINNEYVTQKNEFKAEVSKSEINGSEGTLSLRNEEDIYLAAWLGSRKKDGKYQLVKITFSCFQYSSKFCQDTANYSRSEFLQVLKSIKFN